MARGSGRVNRKYGPPLSVGTHVIDKQSDKVRAADGCGQSDADLAVEWCAFEKGIAKQEDHSDCAYRSPIRF